MRHDPRFGICVLATSFLLLFATVLADGTDAQHQEWDENHESLITIYEIIIVDELHENTDVEFWEVDACDYDGDGSATADRAQFFYDDVHLVPGFKWAYDLWPGQTVTVSSDVNITRHADGSISSDHPELFDMPSGESFPLATALGGLAVAGAAVGGATLYMRKR